MATVTQHFEEALNRTLLFEGGWSDDSEDRGGKTKYGITEGTWKQYCVETGAGGGISNITKADASAVYRLFYWDRPGYGLLVGSATQGILNELFDCGVNCGVNTSVRLLQVAVNVVGVGVISPVVVDGKLGPQTAYAVDRLCRIVSHAQALLGALRGERYTYYLGIIKRNRSQSKFVRGWLKRLV